MTAGKGRTAALTVLIAGAIWLAASAPAVAQSCPDEIVRPAAAFTYSPAAPTAGTNITFDASSSSGGAIHRSQWSNADGSCVHGGTDVDGIDSYRWDFGDGSAPVTSTTPTATRAFATAGTYTVTLTVVADATGSDTTSTAVQAKARLNVTMILPAGGAVTSDDNPRQIVCGSMCTGTYTGGTAVRLTATPASGYEFLGWFGACSGTSPTCDLSMTANRAVQASFRNPAPAVSFQQPEGQWVRGPMNMLLGLTDFHGPRAPVRFELLQRTATWNYVLTDTAEDGDITGGIAGAPLSPTSAHPDHADGVLVRIHACDSLGSCDWTVRAYGIDRVQPTITEASAGPADVVGPGTQVLRFSTADATSGVASHTCRVDSGPSQPCAGSWTTNQWRIESTHTTSGRHTWTVDVRDVAGNAQILTRTFTVDADPPDTAITAGPVDGSSSTATTAEFTFGAVPSDNGATYRCRIFSVSTAPAVFGDCSGTGASHVTSGLPPGTYRFEVAARDAVGNTDPTPAGRTFTVVAPGTGGGQSTGSGGTGETGSTNTGTAVGATVGATVNQPTDTIAQPPVQQNVTPPPTTKPGKCAKLKGKKRAACVRKACGKLKKKSAKKYRACVKEVTRPR